MYHQRKLLCMRASWCSIRIDKINNVAMVTEPVWCLCNVWWPSSAPPHGNRRKCFTISRKVICGESECVGVWVRLRFSSISSSQRQPLGRPSHAMQHHTAGEITPMAPRGLVMTGCWQINSILTNIGRRNSIRNLNEYPFFWNILIWVQFICFIKLFAL